jgi:hypothetical protein
VYHERWDRVAYLALRHTLLAGHVLRRATSLAWETSALLILYQLLPMAMVTAVEPARPWRSWPRTGFGAAAPAGRHGSDTTPKCMRRPVSR